jgi:hypothetical protein
VASVNLRGLSLQWKHAEQLLNAARLTGYVDDHSIVTNSVFEASNALLQCAAGSCGHRCSQQVRLCWRDSGLPRLRLL